MTKAELRHGLPESTIHKILGILAGYPAIEQVIACQRKLPSLLRH